MNQINKLLAEFVSLLDNSGLCDHIRILETSNFSHDQFTFKIRTKILSSYSLQIRIYYNKGHCDYSYQVFEKEPLCRWDNKEHFHEIVSFPHHYHTLSGKVLKSPFKGNPADDLVIVLKEIANLIANQELH